MAVGGAVFEVSDATIMYYDLVRMSDKADFNISLDCSDITTNASAVIVWCVHNDIIITRVV